MMKRKIFAVAAGLLMLPVLLAAQQKGYSIRVKVDGYTGREIYLGYYFGEKTYVKDTVAKGADGWFEFSGDEPLPAGMYMAVLPPKNTFVQVLVDSKNQHITMSTAMPDPVKNMEVEDKGDNKVFYNYIKFIDEQQVRKEGFDKRMSLAVIPAQEKAALQDSVKHLNQLVKFHQYEMFAFFPEYLVSAIIKASIIPEPTIKFSGTEAEQKDKRFYWIRDHWFDNLNMGDTRMLRTQVQFEHVSHYVNNMTEQQPDSVIVAIDKVLQLARPSPETFKYYLIHFLNTYAKSNVVGMDAVYVHLAQKYYATGQAPWMKKEELQKIVDNATRLAPLLIGQKAPDIPLQTKDSKTSMLHAVKSGYTILYFWSAASREQEQLKELLNYVKANPQKKITVLVICQSENAKDCGYVGELDASGQLLTPVDPAFAERALQRYYVRSTPMMYVLDEGLRIMSKNIAPRQLEQVLGK